MLIYTFNSAAKCYKINITRCELSSTDCKVVLHKPAGQIRPAKSRQVARKVQQESLWRNMAHHSLP